MENATKALLIAAAVLITIVIIAFGVTLLGSAGDSSDDAKNVANALQDSTTNVAKNLVTDITSNF